MFLLTDPQLVAMGKAIDKTKELNTLKFYRCDFLAVGTNSLFFCGKASPMKIIVLETPENFFYDCEQAIKSDMLTSLFIITGTDSTPLDFSDFLSVVNIHRAIAEKDLGILF